ncbi:AraC family transcriptional regulator with amidase-like domain [Isoptericola jiangsuensis]|uniref:AraC family transcriptional regulator with amidase-like domain n=1 Tax=Isoptericola jiangsuensis TaxID=548579 RepID=A0A2A9F0D6_9MICO|nr:helix-turn-helix domain-containing protein [Isoptericola jiangsuensis]PFG44012.1 AraC family transcriptional regulator with amidase-like domain [Isoptericola jiangsuensis]
MIRKVAALVVPGVAPFELGIAYEVFGIDRSATGGPSFDFTLCTPEPGPVMTKGGFPVVVDAGLDAADDADVVIVVAYDLLDTDGHVDVPAAVVDTVRRAHDRGAWLLTLCTGAFVLGAAGLLDGRRCTTHWMYADLLAETVPTAAVDPGVLYVQDGKILTSAGTAAGIDAALHLLRTELGGQATRNVARRMVVPPQRDGGQAQYVVDPVPDDATSLRDLLDWMRAHLAEPHTVPTLARRAMLSERTFARRFRAETGTTPASWLVRQRLARAQELLEGTTASVDEIADAVGFGSAAVLRHHFTRVLRTSPSTYRRRFADVAS